jgi:hypothetical protein
MFAPNIRTLRKRLPTAAGIRSRSNGGSTSAPRRISLDMIGATHPRRNPIAVDAECLQASLKDGGSGFI